MTGAAQTTRDGSDGPRPGQVLGPAEVGPVAHGGHCVVRCEGLVVFTRGALPGELVTLRVTEVRSKYARGEVVEVHRASPQRRTPPCPVADRCGGCDFQHVTAPGSRELKAAVVAELLANAGIDHAPMVEAVEPEEFGWRTRMRYHRGHDGRVGLLAHRSGEVVALPAQGCLIAAEAIAGPLPPGPEGRSEGAVGGLDPSTGAGIGVADVLGVAADSGVLLGRREDLPATVTERVGGRAFEVATTGFWQSHARAPEVLVGAVLEALAPQPGERAFDLYCGVGLFAAALADAGCRVWGVEGERIAVALARRNVRGARFTAGDVADVLRRLPSRTELVVLDPPRAGAGRRVMEAVAARQPRAIAYVACDPAALARDLATAAGLGYRTVSVRAFDLYPLTHHVECVALLQR
jgi:tRNA/tmRNA/rRNA uracil-C5-methylase (TrmA/RlmC/RlmD family)